MRFQAPRGTSDILPAESHRWQRLEREFLELARLYGYREIRTPMFEEYDLFVRSSGESSEVVTKQMYDFTDKGDRHIALKPEGTAPAMRALIEHNLCPQGQTERLSYVTPFFRYERPQKGRQRQAHQAGLELVGSSAAAADAEVIEVTVRFFEQIGLSEVTVLLNSLGRSECRDRYRQALLVFARPLLQDQGEEMRAKAEKNPLRLLDSKDPVLIEAMRNAPPITSFLEDASKERLSEIQSLLTEARIAYKLAPEIVRGLDYYTETVFEVQSSKLGSQSALCGGGRYDDLIRDLGGPPMPAVGVGIGMERTLIVLDEEDKSWEEPLPEVFVVQATEGSAHACRRLARDLRADGFSVFIDVDGKKMAAQLKQADRLGARKALILGDDELAKGVATVKDLATGQQEEVSLADVPAVLRESSL